MTSQPGVGSFFHAQKEDRRRGVSHIDVLVAEATGCMDGIVSCME
ncbi:hypothetical protein [Selenomonas sp. GACV-9]